MKNTELYCLTLRAGEESLTVSFDDTVAAYAAFEKAAAFALATGIPYCDLWWQETGEVVACLASEEEAVEEEEFFDEYDLEIGFDPYEGDYTWDC